MQRQVAVPEREGERGGSPAGDPGDVAALRGAGGRAPEPAAERGGTPDLRHQQCAAGRLAAGKGPYFYQYQFSINVSVHIGVEVFFGTEIK